MAGLFYRVTRNGEPTFVKDKEEADKDVIPIIVTFIPQENKQTIVTIRSIKLKRSLHPAAKAFAKKLRNADPEFGKFQMTAEQRTSNWKDFILPRLFNKPKDKISKSKKQ